MQVKRKSTSYDRMTFAVFETCLSRYDIAPSGKPLESSDLASMSSDVSCAGFALFTSWDVKSMLYNAHQTVYTVFKHITSINLESDMDDTCAMSLSCFASKASFSALRSSILSYAIMTMRILRKICAKSV